MSEVRTFSLCKEPYAKNKVSKGVCNVGDYQEILREVINGNWLILIILMFVSCLGIEQDCGLKTTAQKMFQKTMYPLACL